MNNLSEEEKRELLDFYDKLLDLKYAKPFLRKVGNDLWVLEPLTDNPIAKKLRTLIESCPEPMPEPRTYEERREFIRKQQAIIEIETDAGGTVHPAYWQLDQMLDAWDRGREWLLDKDTFRSHYDPGMGRKKP